MTVPKRAPIQLPWPLSGLAGGVVGCGCLVGVLFAGLVVVLLGVFVQASVRELWLGTTSRPISVTVTHTDMVVIPESRTRSPYRHSTYMIDTCHQKTFFQAGPGREHWLDTHLHDGRCTLNETGKPDLAAGQTIQVRKSVFDDGYSLTGWTINLMLAALVAGFLAVQGLRALWLLRKYRPPLLAWLKRGP